MFEISGNTWSVGTNYYTIIKTPEGSPLKDSATTQETEPPFRQGTGTSYRIPFGRSFVFGKWSDPKKLEWSPSTIGDKTDQVLLAYLETQPKIEKPISDTN